MAKRTRQAWMGAILLAIIAVAFAFRFAGPGSELELKQNYPNPFSGATEIRYVTPSTGHVLLRVFNALGAEIAVLVNDKRPLGESVARFDGSNYPSGQYTYVLEFASDDDGSKGKFTRRMNLVR
jgi:hypothetical protein